MWFKTKRGGGTSGRNHGVTFSTTKYVVLYTAFPSERRGGVAPPATPRSTARNIPEKKKMTKAERNKICQAKSRTAPTVSQDLERIRLRGLPRQSPALERPRCSLSTRTRKRPSASRDRTKLGGMLQVRFLLHVESSARVGIHRWALSYPAYRWNSCGVYGH